MTRRLVVALTGVVNAAVWPYVMNGNLTALRILCRSVIIRGWAFGLDKPRSNITVIRA